MEFEFVKLTAKSQQRFQCELFLKDKTKFNDRKSNNTPSYKKGSNVNIFQISTLYSNEFLLFHF